MLFALCLPCVKVMYFGETFVQQHKFQDCAIGPLTHHKLDTKVLLHLSIHVPFILILGWRWWPGQRQKSLCILLQRHIKKLKFCVGFMVEATIRHWALAYTPVDERLAVYRWLMSKPRRKRMMIWPRMPFLSASITVMSAALATESILCSATSTAGRAKTSPNGLRRVAFTWSRIVCSTRFHHKKIYYATWLSQARNTLSRIEHVVIDGRHTSSV